MLHFTRYISIDLCEELDDQEHEDAGADNAEDQNHLVPLAPPLDHAYHSVGHPVGQELNLNRGLC